MATRQGSAQKQPKNCVSFRNVFLGWFLENPLIYIYNWLVLNPSTLLQPFARSFHGEHYGHPGCSLNAYHDQRSAQFSIILLTLMIRSQVEFLLVKANDPIQPSIEQHQACNNVAHTNVSPIQFEWTSISL